MRAGGYSSFYYALVEMASSAPAAAAAASGSFVIEEGEIKEEFKHVAWMGGSLSPPTLAHFMVAKAMGQTLSESTDGMCAVCIVPVSPAYSKNSIKEACIPKVARIQLAEALVAALHADNKNPRLRFFIAKHEFNSETAVPTVDSVATLQTNFPHATIYISQGLDNVEAIFKRKWVRSDELLTRGFIVYPRGDKDTVSVLTAALTSPQSESKEGKFAPVAPADIPDILRRTKIVPVEFNDDTSSSLLRKNIREGGDISALFHPAVYAKYLEMKAMYPSMYATDICEEVKKGGYRRSKNNRKQKTRNNRRSRMRRSRNNRN